MTMPLALPSHLIIVCCHGIYPDSIIYPSGRSSNEENWLIEPFQVGEVETYIKHVEAGVRALAKEKDKAILVFSGGATKPDKTKVTEADGYLVSAWTSA